MESGFYKNDNGTPLYAPNFVINKNFELLRENKDGYTYPVDGWTWFDSVEEAAAAMGFELPEAPDAPPVA